MSIKLTPHGSIDENPRQIATSVEDGDDDDLPAVGSVADSVEVEEVDHEGVTVVVVRA